MNKLKELTDKSLQSFLSFLLAAMVLVISWQVMSRYLLGDPSTWTEETARFLLVWIGMYGAAYAYSQKMHLGIDLLTSKLRGIAAVYVAQFSVLVCGLFGLCAMVIGGTNLVILTWELNQTSPALGISIAYVYSAIPISGLLICFYCVVFFVSVASETLSAESTGGKS